ncbi:MAG: hypothetical protein CXX81_07590 [Methanobacteriota archaeon]|nr:MAG: hypothetical protein CXX81_24465 [Euryarchaeota archaeon]PXY78472.1 MAG: hypothetical protein CXX81_07590 [Euryarchaeota archaeon]
MTILLKEKIGVGVVATLLFVSAIFVIFTEELVEVFDDLPECSEDTLFNNEMFDIEEINNIVPLGNYNPPGHTFPTEHMYVVFNQTSSMKVFAPGNVKVTYIGSKEYSGDQFEDYTDYDITMKSCDDVSMHLMHMQLDSELLSKGGGVKECHSYQTHDSEIEMCEFESDFWIDSGALLGTASAQYSNFDIGVKDSRVTNEFIDKEVNAHFLDSVCPFTYFTTDIRQQMESKAGGWGGEGNVINPCGEIMFDIYGTAQGSWVKDGTPRNSDTLYDEYGLGLYYDNIKQDDMIISSSSEGGYSYRFVPSDTGLINRSFSSIVADGNVYCYETGYNPNDIILIQLIDDEHLKIERKNGPLSCSESGDIEFSDDAELFVRYETSPPDWYLAFSQGDGIGVMVPILLSSIALLISLVIGFSVYRRMNRDKLGRGVNE